MASVHMDRFNRRENGHLIHGISSPKSSSSSSSRGDSDVDFADVFGGPPRRFSTQEFRYSFGELPGQDSKTSSVHEERQSVLSRNPWSGMEEKPVFGSYEGVNRRRYPSNDFYDDIFRGDDSHSSPRMSDQVPLSSPPGSSFLSPVHPPPPKSDPFGSSFPFQFSIPAKSSGSDESSSSFPARQSSVNLQKDDVDDDLRSETRPSYRPSPLSSECFVSQEHKSDKIINSNTSLLHFSIYKWASKGAPPSFAHLIRSNSLKSNRKHKIHRCSSSNGRIQDMAEFPCPTESPEIHKSTAIEFPAEKEGKEELNEEQRKGSNKTVTEKQEPKACKSSDDDVVVQRAKLPKNDNASQGLDDSQKRLSSENLRRNAAPIAIGGGKVKDFVKIFSQQEDPGKLQNDNQTRIQNSRWKQHVPNSKENLHELKQQDNNMNTKREPEKQNKIHSKSRQNSFRRKEASSDSGSLPNPSKTVYIDMDDLSEDNFQVKELPNDQGILPGIVTTSDNQDLDLDSKIRQWSKGKEGNIRSLLSTLQFVLWGNSGWKPVALVDIIEGNAVKRAYQRALLYLHPDKLQQKCSDPHQKYIAEKVFKILQEAWDHFNTLGAL